MGRSGVSVPGSTSLCWGGGRVGSAELLGSGETRKRCWSPCSLHAGSCGMGRTERRGGMDVTSLCCCPSLLARRTALVAWATPNEEGIQCPELGRAGCIVVCPRHSRQCGGPAAQRCPHSTSLQKGAAVSAQPCEVQLFPHSAISHCFLTAI